MKKKYFMTLIAAAGLMVAANALAAKSAPVFYPGGSEQPRIQFLQTINGSNFFGAANPYGNRFPNYHPGDLPETNPLDGPYGVTVAGGKIFVCDQLKKTIAAFDLVKKETVNFGDDKLVLPINIAVGADGTRYIADAGAGRVVVYDAKNVYVASYGKDGFKPVDVIVSKGKLYAVDVDASQVVAMSMKGDELFRFGGTGSSDGQLYKPTNLTSDADGNIYVSDMINGRVSVFSEQGKFQRNVGKLGDALGQFARPKGVAVDREGRLYAVDAAFENVQIFNKEGKLLMPFGVVGNVPGGVNMPQKIALDYDHTKYFADKVAPGYGIEYLIMVTNQTGENKVNVYGFLKKK